jgi:NADPH:quinone reductase-like Zn-dependent oxidoreductase
MKAIVYRDSGSPDVLQCEQIEKPLPGDNEVLIKVRAAALNPLDWRLMRGGPALVQLLLGGRKPKRMGRDVAGEVEAVGSKVTQLKRGDAVFGGCRGALADYVCASESAVASKPENLTFEQAASVPIAGWTALQGLRDKGHVQPGQRVLINGAAGGVGTFAVQIAKYLGADVTGVCSTRNVEMVRGIGADHVLDYTLEDFTKGDARYDLILDCIANHSPNEVRRVLQPKGKCVLVGAPHDVGLIALLVGLMKLLVMAPFTSQKVVTMMARRSQGDLKFLAGLMQEGKVTPVIDRCYGFGDTAEAVRYLEEGHARGKVVVTVSA